MAEDPPLDDRPSRSARVGFSILLTASIVLLAALVSSLWQPLFMAAVLASALHRLHERLARRLRGHRAISALLVTLSAVVLILLPFAGIAVVIVREAAGAAAFARDALAAGGVEGLTERLPEPVAAWTVRAGRAVSEGGLSILERAAEGSLAAASALTGLLSRGGSVLAQVVLMLIGLDFMLADGPSLLRWLGESTPLPARHVRELLAELSGVIRSVLGSTVVTAAVQGAAATIGYAIAGVPQFLFFGILTMFAAFIPSIGTALVGLPLIGLLVVLHRIGSAIFLTAWLFLVVGLVDNLLRPLLIRGDVPLHGAVIFFSLIAGVALFGPAGIVAGPLTVALFVALVRLAKRDFRELFGTS